MDGRDGEGGSWPSRQRGVDSEIEQGLADTDMPNPTKTITLGKSHLGNALGRTVWRWQMQFADRSGCGDGLSFSRWQPHMHLPRSQQQQRGASTWVPGPPMAKRIRGMSANGSVIKNRATSKTRSIN